MAPTNRPRTSADQLPEPQPPTHMADAAAVAQLRRTFHGHHSTFGVSVMPVEPTLRKRCCYCAVKHPMDALGPILDGEMVSDGICPIALAVMSAELDAKEQSRCQP